MNGAGTRLGYMGHYNSADVVLALENSADFAIMNGNVGIGTTAPGEKLEVAGTIKINTGAAPAIFQQANSSRTWQYIADDSPDFLGIYDGTDYRLKFEGTGNTYFSAGAGSGFVGIGTEDPLSKLGVLGNLSVGATYGAIAAPTSGAIFEGNVGIGTTGPSNKLTVFEPTQFSQGLALYIKIGRAHV